VAAEERLDPTSGRGPDWSPGQSSGPLALGVSPGLIEHLADLVAARVADAIPDRPEPYLDVDAAAEYLAAPRSRIYDLVERGAVPVHRDGRRLLFRASELDAYLEAR